MSDEFELMGSSESLNSWVQIIMTKSYEAGTMSWMNDINDIYDWINELQ